MEVDQAVERQVGVVDRRVCVVMYRRKVEGLRCSQRCSRKPECWADVLQPP